MQPKADAKVSSQTVNADYVQEAEPTDITENVVPEGSQTVNAPEDEKDPAAEFFN